MLDLANRSHSNPEGKNTKKPWKWILVDSLIMGLIGLVAAMPSAAPTGPELYLASWVMLKAFLAGLTFQLVVERGLKR